MMYYSLTNYYQNHRRYVKSRDDNQLQGIDGANYNSLTGDCSPFRGNETSNYAYAPCGAIANSMFNGKLIFCCFHYSVLLTVKVLQQSINSNNNSEAVKQLIFVEFEQISSYFGMC